MATDEPVETQNIASPAFSPSELAIAVFTPDHTAVCWNSHAERMTGYDLGALNATGIAQIFEPADVFQQMFRTAGAGIATPSAQLRLRRADGQLVPVEVQCSPLHSVDSERRVVIAMCRVGPLCADHLYEKQSSLSRLAASVSHDIRNPLNAVFLHMDIIEEELRLPTPDSRGQVEQSLATIKTEVTRLHDLMQDYLSLARLPNLPRESEDLGALVEAFTQEMQAQLAVRGVTLNLEGFDDFGEFPLHKSLFRRTLVNILRRLMDVMPRGGTLTLSGRRSASHLYLSIRDSGKGIPSAAWAAFSASMQAANPEAIDLSVYVAREIIAAHGGEVAVTHEPGRGTACTVTLPLAATQ
jgi:PAS domain S-box-containing protein